MNQNELFCRMILLNLLMFDIHKKEPEYFRSALLDVKNFHPDVDWDAYLEERGI